MSLVKAKMAESIEIHFPDTRYMGSKRKLLSSLEGIFRQIKFKSALDAFSGTASVAYLLKRLGKSIHSNDYLRFNYHIARALIENSRVILSDDEINELIQPANEKESFIERQFSGLYYSKKDCRWLDSIVANIEFLANPFKKSIALTALCRACIKKRPRGIFTYVGMRYDDGRKDLKTELADHFVEAAKMINSSVFEGGANCKAFNQDIMKLKNTDYDLVYFDPPYFSMKSDNEYSRRYHFLEGLVSYWNHVQIDHSTKTKKFKRLESPFTHRDSFVNAFDELFDRYRKSKIILSYSSNCYPDANTLKAMLRNHGKAPELVEIDYVYSVGTHSHKKNNQTNRVKEYVFLGL